MTPIADNGMKRAAPLSCLGPILRRFFTRCRDVRSSIPAKVLYRGAYFSKEPGSQAAGQSMRKVVIERTGVKKDKQTTASPIFPSPLTEREDTKRKERFCRRIIYACLRYRFVRQAFSVDITHTEPYPPCVLGLKVKCLSSLLNEEKLCAVEFCSKPQFFFRAIFICRHRV